MIFILPCNKCFNKKCDCACKNIEHICHICTYTVCGMAHKTNYSGGGCSKWKQFQGYVYRDEMNRRIVQINEKLKNI